MFAVLLFQYSKFLFYFLGGIEEGEGGIIATDPSGIGADTVEA